MSSWDTRVRRERSKCRRARKAEIEAAKKAGDEAKAKSLEASLAKLEQRWSMGLNSRTEKMFERPVGRYFFSR